MKVSHKNLLLLSFLIVYGTFFAFTSHVMAVTDDDAVAAGAGFHEPGGDWYDPDYKYRIPINISSDKERDVDLVNVFLNYSDYFEQDAGIIDVANMELVRLGENESLIPVNYHLETDLVDIWNAPTLVEIEDVILGTLISENATFIGTVFNGYEGTGLMNQSIRFQVNLSEPTDEVRFQFIYNPSESYNISETDYILAYAGNPMNWGTPIRIYPSMLPQNVSKWTQYFTLPMENETDGLVWINLETPTLHGNQIKYFSIDFSFLDDQGFERKVQHFVPELDVAEGVIEQSNYYPRVHVLQHDHMPCCKMYFQPEFIENESLSNYFLYFNFMNESTYEIIDNIAVPFIGEIATPQTYYRINVGNALIYIDKDEIGYDGSYSIISEDELVNFSRSFLDSIDENYDASSYFGTVFSSGIMVDDDTRIVHTLHYGRTFIDMDIESNVSLLLHERIFMNTSYPLIYLMNETYITNMNLSSSVSGESNYLLFSSYNGSVCILLLFDDSVSYSTTSITPNVSYDLDIGIGQDIFMSLHVIDVNVSYAVDGGLWMRNEAERLYSLFMNRMSFSFDVNVSDEVERFQELQVFVLNAKSGLFGYYVVGDTIDIALFGHNLQSITVEINGKTNETASNGSYAVPSFTHDLFEVKYNFTFRGRNEFGEVVTKTYTFLVADSVIDIPRVLFMSILILPVMAFFGISLLSIAMIKNRRIIRHGKECSGDDEGFGSCSIA